MDEIKDLKTLNEWIKTCPTIELPYIIEKLEEYKKALYMHSKFKVGDRVVLVKEPTISEKERWGWMSYRSYFKEGTGVIIKEVEWHKGKFRYGVIFDAQKDTGMFFLEEEYFELAPKVTPAKICPTCLRLEV